LLCFVSFFLSFMLFPWNKDVGTPPWLFGHSDAGDTEKRTGSSVLFRFLHAVSDHAQSSESCVRENGDTVAVQPLQLYEKSADLNNAVSKYATNIGVVYDHFDNKRGFNAAYKALLERGVFVKYLDLSIGSLGGERRNVLEMMAMDQPGPEEEYEICAGFSADPFLRSTGMAIAALAEERVGGKRWALKEIGADGVVRLDANGEDDGFLMYSEYYDADGWDASVNMKGLYRFSAADCDLVCSLDHVEHGCDACAAFMERLIDWEQAEMEKDLKEGRVKKSVFSSALHDYAEHRGIALPKYKASQKSMSVMAKSRRYEIINVYCQLANAIMSEIAPGTSPEDIASLVRNVQGDSDQVKKRQKMDDVLKTCANDFAAAMKAKDEKVIIATGCLLVSAGVTHSSIQVCLAV
jgi:hypothetical protein